MTSLAARRLVSYNTSDPLSGQPEKQIQYVESDSKGRATYRVSHGFRLDAVHGPAQADQAEWQILRRDAGRRKGCEQRDQEGKDEGATDVMTPKMFIRMCGFRRAQM